MYWLVKVILYVSVFSAAPAVWLGRRLRGLLWYYGLASLCCDAIPFVLKRSIGFESAIPTNVFNILELTLIGLYFWKAFSNKLLRRAIVTGITVLSILFIFDTWHIVNERVNWPSQAFSQIFLLLLCIGGLFNVLRDAEYQKIEQSSLFLVSSSFLLYVAYSLLLMLFTEQFSHTPASLRSGLWSIHNLLNILKNLAIARIFVVQRKALRP
jgi:hypothetical protein